MSITRFFVDALAGALDVGLATPDDLLRHVTPDVLAGHLPRPLWGKLIAACLAAPRTDARLVVDTIGVPALCEHMPGTILWSIVADVATRALGKGLVASPPPPAALAAAVTATMPAMATAPAVPAAEVSATVAAAPATVAAAPATVAAAPSPIADKSKSVTRTKSPTEEWSSGTPAAATPIAADSGPASKSGSVPVVAAPAKAPVSTPAGPRDKTPVPITVPPAITPRAQTATVTTTSAAPAATASVPSAVVDIDFDDDDLEPAPLDAPPMSPHRAPTVPGPAASRAAPSNGRGTTPPSAGAGASSRRPQASAAPRAGSRTTPPSPRRGAATNSDFDLDTDVGTKESEGVDVPVDDDQLIDWAASEETVTSGVDTDRKR